MVMGASKVTTATEGGRTGGRAPLLSFLLRSVPCLEEQESHARLSLALPVSQTPSASLHSSASQSPSFLKTSSAPETGAGPRGARREEAVEAECRGRTDGERTRATTTKWPRGRPKKKLSCPAQRRRFCVHRTLEGGKAFFLYPGGPPLSLSFRA